MAEPNKQQDNIINQGKSTLLNIDNRLGTNLALDLELSVLKKRFFQIAVDAVLGRNVKILGIPLKRRTNNTPSFRTITQKWMAYINADYVKLVALSMLFSEDNIPQSALEDKSSNIVRGKDFVFPFKDITEEGTVEGDNKAYSVNLISSHEDFAISFYSDDEIRNYAKELASGIPCYYNKTDKKFYVQPVTEELFIQYLNRLFEKYRMEKNKTSINYKLRAAATASKREELKKTVDETIKSFKNESSKSSEKYSEYTSNADTANYEVTGFKELQQEIDVVITQSIKEMDAMLSAARTYAQTNRKDTKGAYNVEERIKPYIVEKDAIEKVLNDRRNQIVRSIIDGNTNISTILGMGTGSNKEAKKIIKNTAGEQGDVNPIKKEGIEEPKYSNIYEEVSAELDNYLLERLQTEENLNENVNLYKTNTFNHSYPEVRMMFMNKSSKSLLNIEEIENEDEVEERKEIEKRVIVYDTLADNQENGTENTNAREQKMEFVTFFVYKYYSQRKTWEKAPCYIYSIKIPENIKKCCIVPVLDGSNISSSKIKEFLYEMWKTWSSASKELPSYMNVSFNYLETLDLNPNEDNDQKDSYLPTMIGLSGDESRIEDQNRFSTFCKNLKRKYFEELKEKNFLDSNKIKTKEDVRVWIDTPTTDINYYKGIKNCIGEESINDDIRSFINLNGPSSSQNGKRIADMLGKKNNNLKIESVFRYTNFSFGNLDNSTPAKPLCFLLGKSNGDSDKINTLLVIDNLDQSSSDKNAQNTGIYIGVLDTKAITSSFSQMTSLLMPVEEIILFDMTNE